MAKDLENKSPIEGSKPHVESPVELSAYNGNVKAKERKCRLFVSDMQAGGGNSGAYYVEMWSCKSMLAANYTACAV